jgi:hypothetical protein
VAGGVSLQQFDGMGDGVGDEREAFDRAFGTAGEADDQRFADDCSEVA